MTKILDSRFNDPRFMAKRERVLARNPDLRSCYPWCTDEDEAEFYARIERGTAKKTAGLTFTRPLLGHAAPPPAAPPPQQEEQPPPAVPATDQPDPPDQLSPERAEYLHAQAVLSWPHTPRLNSYALSILARTAGFLIQLSE